jgi:kinesin family protein 6/9
MANTKNQINEAKSINLSLHYLEQVIVSLRVNARQNASASRNGSDANFKGGHVPYRNSVLTNMLRDSLGGNCKSCFLLTISPEAQHFEETVSTCRYVLRFISLLVSFHHIIAMVNFLNS